MKRVYAGDMCEAQRALHRRYGNLVRIAPDEVSSSNVDDIPLIFRNKDPLMKTDLYPLFTQPEISEQPNLFSALDENFHAQLKRTVNSVYTFSNILKHEDYVGSCTDLLIQRLGEFADTKEPVDFAKWLQM
jgi:hypothetical protein